MIASKNSQRGTICFPSWVGDCGKRNRKALKPRKQYNKDIPGVTKKQVGRYARIHGTKAAFYFFNEKYP